jgi:hypothetical protein
MRSISLSIARVSTEAMAKRPVARRSSASISADQGQRFVHQHGGAETKGFDALCNLPDLRLRVGARIARIGFDFLDRQQAIYALPRDHCVPPAMWVDGTDLERVGGPKN